MKLAEALVLRKHLEAKVKQLEPIYINGQKGVFETKTERRNISDTVDEVTIQTPKVKLEDITGEYDKYSKALRELDTAIQHTNWVTELAGKVSLEDIKV